MEFKVIFKDSFLADLKGLLRWIAPHDPAAARRLGETLVRAAEQLRFFPERHPRIRQRPAIRRFIAGKHFKVFYRIQSATRTVEILRCWDGRREANPGIQP